MRLQNGSWHACRLTVADSAKHDHAAGSANVRLPLHDLQPFQDSEEY